MNGPMYRHMWTFRCVGPSANEPCARRATSGLFCVQHAWEVSCDEAAKAATRLARARMTLREPSSTLLQQVWARCQVHAAQSQRRHLLRAITRFEDTGVAGGAVVASGALVATPGAGQLS